MEVVIVKVHRCQDEFTQVVQGGVGVDHNPPPHGSQPHFKNVAIAHRLGVLLPTKPLPPERLVGRDERLQVIEGDGIAWVGHPIEQVEIVLQDQRHQRRAPGRSLDSFHPPAFLRLRFPLGDGDDAKQIREGKIHHARPDNKFVLLLIRRVFEGVCMDQLMEPTVNPPLSGGDEFVGLAQRFGAGIE